jgi:hypothetical protein
MSGIDFINRASLGYAVFELLNGLGGIKEALRLYGTGKVEFPFGIKVEPLKTPTFENGWSAGSVPVRYRVGPDGMVKMSGIFQGGTAVSGTVMGMFEAGDYPERTEVFVVPANDVGVATVGVTSTGQIVYLSGGNVKIDVSSISFYRA